MFKEQESPLENYNNNKKKRVNRTVLVVKATFNFCSIGEGASCHSSYLMQEPFAEYCNNVNTFQLQVLC